MTHPGRQLLEQTKNQHFKKLSILLFPPCRALAGDFGTGKVSCAYSGIVPQLPWLATAALIEETSSLVNPWLVTTGTTRLECAIFHTKHIFYNDNSYKRLQGSPHRQCLPVGASTLCRAVKCNTLQLCRTAKVTRHMPLMRSCPHEKRIFCRPFSGYQNCGTRSVNLV